MKKNCAVLTAAALSCAVLAGCGQKQEGTLECQRKQHLCDKGTGCGKRHGLYFR